MKKKNPTNLVERERLVEEEVSSNQSDAEFEVTEHVVADRGSQERMNRRNDG